MPVLINAILIFWISTAGVQASSYCSFPKINHGIVYGKEDYEELLPIAVGEIYYYSCEYNFATPSRSFWTRIICTEEGWSPTPKCLRQCFFPSVENGYSASSGKTHLEGDIVQIVCDVGYSLPDNSDTISCLKDGWSSPPKCSTTNTECPLPVFIEKNVHIYPRQLIYKAGDVLTFSCGEGLKRVGPDSVQCYHFGWSPNFPTCKGQVKSCGQPPQLLNGKIKEIKNEEYGHGETVEYECPPYFLMTGPAKIQCIDGKWTDLPTCVGQVKACDSIPHFENGYAQFSILPFQHGISVELNCRDTYTMIGNNVITCIDGMWTELPKCVETSQLKSCQRPMLHAGIIMNTYVSYNHSARINYRCFWKVRPTPSVCINGKWYPEPSCREKWREFCPPPPQIPNAQKMLTTVNYRAKAKVAVLCKENYLLHGPRQIVCKDGQWQSLPQCIESAQYCGPPPPINNGDITSFPLSAYPPGSRVQYRCQSFYELQGSIDVICRNGQWSEPPKCLDACIISEGNMKKNKIQLRRKDIKKLYVKTGDFIEFDCKEPYKAKASSQSFRVRCQEGKFEYPMCE